MTNVDLVEKVYDGIHTWYDTITEKNCNHINPYYAAVRVYYGSKMFLFPLPWLFPEIKRFQGLGRELENKKPDSFISDLAELRKELPTWVKKWVEDWQIK